MKYIDVIKKIEENKLSTSEVIQSSFTNVFKELEVNDFVIIENHRKKKQLIIQEIDKYGSISKEVQEIKRKMSPNLVTNTHENKLLAKQYIKENTFYLMRFESENITFPDVEYYTNMKIKNASYQFEQEVTINLLNG